MKILKYLLLVCACLVLTPASVLAQENEGTPFEHHFIVGYNLGATAPLSMPAEVRSINGYHPLLTPQVGYELRYRMPNSSWLLGTGLYFEMKGMCVKDRVKYMYTSVVLSEDDATRFSGYFVGKNKTKVQISYLTLPFYAIRSINETWSVRVGGYVSYANSKKFTGTVSDGYILPENEETGEIGKREEISSATFDFGDDIRNFDVGVLGGVNMKINNKMSAFGNLTWSLTPIFPSGYKPVNFGMYNIYMTLGITRKL